MIRKKNEGAAEGRNQRNVSLDPLTRLRTLYWFRKVLAVACCSPEAMKERILTDESPEYTLYSLARRQPSLETLEAVEGAALLGSSSVRPFAGTKDYFAVGPGKLWEVLGGDLSVCAEIVDQCYMDEFGESELVNATLDKKLNYFRTSLFHADQLEEVTEFISKIKLTWMSYHAAMRMVLDLDDFKHKAYSNFKAGEKYPTDLLVAVLAMRVVGYEMKFNIPELDYMAIGAMRIIADLMPEVAPELIEYFKDDMSKRNIKLFQLDKKGMDLYNNPSKYKDILS